MSTSPAIYWLYQSTSVHTRKLHGSKARLCKQLRSPGIDSTSLGSLLGRYAKSVCCTGPPGWESIPGLLKRSTNTGSGGPVRGTTNRVVVPARQAGNRFLGSLKRFTNTGSGLAFHPRCTALYGQQTCEAFFDVLTGARTATEHFNCN